MYFFKKRELFFVFVLIFIFINLHFSTASLVFLFNQSGSAYLNLSVPYSSLSDFSFTVLGETYNNSYPINVSIDVGNIGVVNWEYRVYNSTNVSPVKYVLNSWSTNLSSSNLDILNMSSDFIPNMFYFGNISNNYFSDNGNNSLTSDGVLGISTSSSDSVSSQILSISTNNGTVHAFIPSMNIDIASVGLYIAKGGATYFCSTSNTSQLDPLCDLSPSEALNSSHLARGVDSLEFNYEEVVKNPNIKNSINNILSSCGLPCNVTIKVSVESPGKITLDNFTFIQQNQTYPASNITIIENNTAYAVNIQNSTNLTSSGYFYGVIPNVYIIPFEASDESRTLSSNQTNRLISIQNNISRIWSNITNNSYPLNFIFYTNITPYKIPGFNLGDNYSVAQRIISLQPPVQFSSPAILVMVDVWDYFPNVSNYNTLGELSNFGVIGNVYVNGINNMSITNLENYNDEILLNVVLHEIAHTFIGYPQTTINGDTLFYTYHPADFRSNNLFSEVYGLSSSPTGLEGYYEIYSIMNPVRAYLKSSELGNINLELSTLDKMLMRILSPSISGNYTFYQGNISQQGNKYIATSMSAVNVRDAGALFLYNSNSYVWDISVKSSAINMNKSTSFIVQKEKQNNSALWIFAKDSSNPYHMQVFNLNSNSSQKVILEKGPVLNITSVDNSTIYSSANLTLRVTSNKSLFSCSFWDNRISGNGSSMSINSSNLSANYTFGFSDGYHNLTFRCDDLNRTNSYISIKNLLVDISYPVINVSIQGNYNNSLYLNESTFNINTEVNDLSFKNITYILCNFNSCNMTSYSYLTNISYILLNQDRYLFNVTVCDTGNRCVNSPTKELIKYGKCKFIINTTNWAMNETTNVFGFNDTQINRASSLNLANSYGKITFLENLNLTNTCNKNTEGYIKSLRDKIEINTSEFPEFNHSAELVFRDIGVTLPILKRNGVDCDSTICSNQVFNSNTNTYTVNVTGFSTYELVEQCSDGVENGDESGIDCGGSCSSCPSSGTSNEEGSRGGVGGSGSGGASIIQNNHPNSTNNDANQDNSPVHLGKITGDAQRDIGKGNVTDNINNIKNSVKISSLTFAILVIIGIYLWWNYLKGKKKKKH